MTITIAVPSRPLPPVAFDHAALFREPVYTDGQPYAEDDGLEDDGD